MRKSARTILVIFLVIVSTASYVYLSTVHVEVLSRQEENTELVEDESTTAGKIKEGILPEVILVKKFLEIGKRLLPSS